MINASPELVPNGLRIPRATYRLQFNRELGFEDAAELLDYLHDLGISDIYASPCLRARPGSPHGYDIVDHSRLNPELGSEQDFERFTERLRQLDMGLVMDIVPNHMCVEGPENATWLDVLENGPSSPHAPFFDINWKPVKQELTDKVLYPILGDQYGTVLENKELQLSFDEGRFHLRYYEHCLPLEPSTCIAILRHRLDLLEQQVPPESPELLELLSIITALSHLPDYRDTVPSRVAERYREKEVANNRLWALCRRSEIIANFIDENLTVFNGRKGDPASFDLLDSLLRKQVYRLSYWRVATEEINYRRFFDINALAAIRMEDPDVFRRVHRRIFELIRQRKVTGLRIDHADGLYHPLQYLQRLQRECFIQTRLPENPLSQEEEQELRSTLGGEFDRHPASPPFPFYVLVEKILMRGEELPDQWPVQGTTGYDFLNLAGGIFVDAQNARELSRIYSRFIQKRLDFHDIGYEKKKLVMRVAMSSEGNTLGHYLNTISEKNRHTRDFTLNNLTMALVEVIACFPVYRTYSTGAELDERDRRYVEYAVSVARQKNPATNTQVFDFIRQVLLLDFPPNFSQAKRQEWVDFVMRFQQFTGPVMAKAMEDTAFYLYNRLTSLNEVGGAPEIFGCSLASFHELNRHRARESFCGMLATATHDTKRSEDVRARISVLSELPVQWQSYLARWRHHNRSFRKRENERRLPDRNAEYLLYQTLLGTWPLEGAEDEVPQSYVERIEQYMLKAAREAKLHTSWIRPDETYEEALLGFVRAVLQQDPQNTFLQDLRHFAGKIAYYGMLGSLSQTLLKIAAPGVPDFYQGTELWDFSLVDPDNRRPVNYSVRRRALEQLRRELQSRGEAPLSRELLLNWRDGRIKLYLIDRGLNFRARNRRLFDEGEYRPLSAEGPRMGELCAFARGDDERAVVAVAPRFFTRRHDPDDSPEYEAGSWEGTRLKLPSAASGQYRDLFTGKACTTQGQPGATTLCLAEVLEGFPVALLERLP